MTTFVCSGTYVTKVNPKPSPHVCKICKKSFSTGFNLNKHAKKHLKSIDPETTPIVSRRVKVLVGCVLCQKKIIKPELYSHYETEHGVKIQSSSHKFPTLEDFFKWKKATEDETNSMYVKYKSDRDLKDGNKKIYYICHRTGVYKSKGQNKRRLKKTGSNKINGYCPAQIVVLKTPDKVLVEFTETHVGHTLEPLRPPPKEPTPKGRRWATRKKKTSNEETMMTKDPNNEVEQPVPFTKTVTSEIHISIPFEDMLDQMSHQDHEEEEEEEQRGLVKGLDSIQNVGGGMEIVVTTEQITEETAVYVEDNREEVRNYVLQQLATLTEIVKTTDDDKVLEVVNSALHSIQPNVDSFTILDISGQTTPLEVVVNTTTN